MLTIYYCDDDATTIEKARTITEEYTKEKQIPLRFLDFSRAEDLLFYIEDHIHEVDLIFLDIFMDELNGMDTAKKLRAKNFKGEIIFVSTSADYVFDAFEVDSFNYLVKGDLSKNHFIHVLEKAIKQVQNEAKNFLQFTMGAEHLQVDIKQIHYFEIHRRVVTVYYDIDRSFDFYYSLEKLSEELLEKDFLRTHRSFLVNMNHIVSIKDDNVLLKGGHEVPIGTTFQQDVRETFQNFLQSTWSQQ